MRVGLLLLLPFLCFARSGAPSLLSVTDDGFGTGNNCFVLLRWKDNSENERAFEVQFLPEGQERWENVGESPANTTALRVELDGPKKGLFRIHAVGYPGFNDLPGECAED